MRGRCCCLLWLPTTQVLGLYAYALFAVMYFVHGLLLLPLELWTPAVEAGAPYKIQGTRRVPRERIVPVVVHSIWYATFDVGDLVVRFASPFESQRLSLCSQEYWHWQDFLQ